jgi:hypothetical protein
MRLPAVFRHKTFKGIPEDGNNMSKAVTLEHPIKDFGMPMLGRATRETQCIGMQSPDAV